MEYIFACLIGYLIGCSSMSYYIGKIKKIDIKNNGSKNLGASNTAMQAGLGAGILVFVHDFLKAFFAVVLCKFIFKNTIGVGEVAGCASVIGHIFPFYLKFNGGKGFASFIGMSIALYPVCGLIAFVIAVLLAILIDYVVCATFSFISFIPIYAIICGSYSSAVLIALISVLIWVKHKENIRHLIRRDGEEKKISAIIHKKRQRKEPPKR